GQNAGLVQPMLQGVKLMIKQYNASYPGCPVELQPLDTQGNVQLAQNAVRQLDAGVLGLVGPVFSSEVSGVGDYLEAQRLPFITPSATSDALSTKGWHMFHRAVAPDSATAIAAADYLASQGKKSIYVVTVQNSYGDTLRDSIGKASGVTIVNNAQF